MCNTTVLQGTAVVCKLQRKTTTALYVQDNLQCRRLKDQTSKVAHVDRRVSHPLF